ncbi:MAG: response regulator [Leptospiraceae bacterium]|nr:response regulator [Leptospiraceae bacterium]MCP5494785.1 response regulator [Leptospiraceae bacterium]
MAVELNTVKGCILLVDDNSDNLKLLSAILIENGFQVKASDSGRYALKIINNTLPDLILLDIKMPEIDGYEVCRRLKSDPLTASIPVIFISALKEEESKVKGFEIGGVDYITKPFQSQEILARVRTHILLSRTQKNLEKTIRERNQADEEMKTLLSTTLEGFWIVDTKGKILEVNQAYCDMLAYSREEILGLSISDVEVNESPTETVKHIEQIIKTGSDQFETKHKRKDGQIIDIAANVTYLDSFGGRFFSFLRDVTKRNQDMEELKKAKQLADTANQAKSQFLANMSHEIRTPLNSIIGFSQILLKHSTKIHQESYLSKDCQKYLSHIVGSGQILNELINDILEISRIEAGKTELIEEDFPLREVIDTLLTTYEFTASQKGVIFSHEIDPELPLYIHVDKIKLNQILMNLLGNAIKFTNPNKKVTITIKKHQSEILFIIQDQGIGISKNRQKAIFETFEQAESSISRSFGGTGLGLAISKGLAELMGGRISVESELGQGSTFQLVIPYKNVISINTNEEKKEQLLRINKDALVLVVEDNLMSQTLLKVFFEDIRINISFADNGQMGIEKAFELEPDLILMDINLPIINGMDATRKIRQNPKFKDTPIIAFSAEAFREQQTQAKNSGITDYLLKPIDINKLEKILNKYLPISKEELEFPEKEEIQNIEETYNENMINALQEILGSGYLDYCQYIKDRLIFDEIESFAKDLIMLGSKYQYNSLTRYAERLQQKARNFEVVELPHILDEFQNIIKDLKTL